MLPNTLSMNEVLKKSLEYLCGLCVILKTDMKNVKILLNLALKRGTSKIFLKSLITFKIFKDNQLKILSY
jgi:hypothetical protein